MEYTVTRGSEWRKWDLHIHTKFTNKNDNFQSYTIDDFCLILFRKALEKSISAIGITDYFSIDNYNAVKNYQLSIDSNTNFTKDEIDKIKQILILPNVELRMSPVTDKEQLINIHCIFNPEYISDLNNSFFNELTFSTGTKEKFKMNKEGFIDLGKAMDPSIQDENKAYLKGISNFIISIGQLEDLLNTNKKFRENTIIVVSNSNKDGASGMQHHSKLFEKNSGDLTGLRQSIYRIADCIFSGNPKDNKYFLGKGVDSAEDVIHKCGSLKPCIHGSDAHKEDDLFNPDLNRYCWIKAELTFEGLKQVLYEPDQRVRVQELEPDLKDEKLIIDVIKFIDNENRFNPNPIKLNKNLNVIIGGKSSGKSILLFYIAKALLADRSLLKKEHDNTKYKYDFEKEFDLEVKLPSNQSILSSRSDDIPSIIPEIKYIPQNYLSKLAEPEGNKVGNELRKLVRGLILENNDAIKLYDNFITALKEMDKEREILINEYFDLKSKQKELNKQLLEKGNEDVLKTNLSKTQNDIEELKKNAGLSTSQIDEYNKLNNELKLIDIGLQKLNKDFQNVKSFNIESGREIAQIINKRTQLLTQTDLDNDIIEYISPFYKNIDIAHKDINSLFNLLEIGEDNKFVNDNIFIEKENIYSRRKNEIEEALTPFVENFELKNKIAELEKIELTDKHKLNDIINIKKSIQTINMLMIEKKDEIFNQYKNTHLQYIDIIKKLNFRSEQLGESIKIFGEVKFNFPKFRKRMEEMSDRRSQSFRNYPQLFNENLLGTSDCNIDSIIENLKKIFEAIIDTETYKIKDSIDIKSSVKALLHDYLFDNWDVEYDGDYLGKMSAGKASFVILVLIIGLSDSKAPILIDQPEDNLDNRSISKGLVEYLKQRKEGKTNYSCNTQS